MIKVREDNFDNYKKYMDMISQANGDERMLMKVDQNIEKDSSLSDEDKFFLRSTMYKGGK